MLPETQSVTTSAQPIVPPKQPYASTAFIDKVTLVLTPKLPKDTAELHGIYNQITGDPDFFQSAGKAVGGYNIAKMIALSDSAERVRLDYAYAEGKAKNIRLEFNPSKIGIDGLQSLHGTLSMMINGGLSRFIRDANISRLDIAVDISGLRMSKILFVQDSSASVFQWKSNGKLQTYQHGKVKGNFTQVYNKSAQLAAKGMPQPGLRTVRVERRMKGLKKKLMALAELPNPFKGMFLYSEMPGCPPGEVKQDYIWQLFKDSVEKRGLELALALLPKNKRTMYRKHFADSKPAWWDPDTIWKDWLAYLEQTKLTNPKSWK